MKLVAMPLGPLLLLTVLALLQAAVAFDYGLVQTDEEIFVLQDVSTQIFPIKTFFLDEPVSVTVDGLTWEISDDTTGSDLLTYETFVNDVLQASGTVNLTEFGKSLPPSLFVGNVTVTSKGTTTLTTRITLDGSTVEVTSTYQAFSAATACVPLVVIIVLALVTRMVEFSLMTTVFVGACMVTGNVKDGFKTSLDTYLLEAVANVDHGFVYLFTLFLSGLVGMIERSGGMHGFKDLVARFATSSRTAQLVTFGIGCAIFFDDYANCLIAGETMRPLTDLLSVSREKLAFIVDATAAPIASLVPVSSWVGFEVGLIQDEIDRLIIIKGGAENLTIDTSGLGVFLQTIKYRYYPIFMIVMMPVLACLKRDFGPMLVAERKVQVYQRLDGGDGGTRIPIEGHVHPNAPRKDTPHYGHNMLFPIAILVFYIFYLLVRTGETGEPQSFWDKLQGADSFSSLAWGTAAAVCTTFLFYVIQIVHDGKFALPTPKVLKGLFSFPRTSDSDEEGAEDDSLIEAAAPPRVLMNLYDASESLLYGMGRIFPALIVLTLAWATGSIMTAVGVDRLFGAWIQNKLDPSNLPTLSFLISAILALATGTSWGTMAIIFPLITVPTYEATGGDPLLFYATLAGVLSGAVSGDHASPISDTTVLSALASQCKLLAHVTTQAPYALFIIIVSVLFGTLPIGRKAWPNIVGIILGSIFILITVYLLGRPIVNETGRYDIFTELILRCKPSEELKTLKQDTIDFYAAGTQQATEESLKDLDPNDSILKDDVESSKIFPAESIDHDDLYLEGKTKSLLRKEGSEEEES